MHQTNVNSKPYLGKKEEPNTMTNTQNEKRTRHTIKIVINKHKVLLVDTLEKVVKMDSEIR